MAELGSKAARSVLYLVIPALALTVATRQFVLQHRNNLSIWEGGGMGMFAAIGGFSRTLNIFLVDEDGNRHPIVALTDRQSELANFARKHPTDDNFARLARAVRDHRWVALDEPVPRRSYDRTGAVLGSSETLQYLFYSASEVPAGVPTRQLRPAADATVSIAIELWKIRYDPEQRIASSNLAKTFVLP